MKGSASNGKKNNGFSVSREIDWEVRPGGMLVQKRNDGDDSSAIFINIKVSHASYHHHLTISAQSTFGDLKRILSGQTGLEPREQRLLFRGKEKDDDECLHMAGVNDQSKVVLLEDPASRERKLREMNKNRSLSKSYEAFAGVRTVVDKLSEKVATLETAFCGGYKVADNDLNALTELLILQLLKLDAIEAGGDAKLQKENEVRRVQSYVEKVYSLKVRKYNPMIKDGRKMASVRTKWERFESGFGSLSAPPLLPSIKMSHEWEMFD